MVRSLHRHCLTAMTSNTELLLAGRSIAVTRAHPGKLDAGIEAAGGMVVSVPVIAFVDPDDGGEAVRVAVRDLARGVYDWVAVTSSVGAQRLVDALGNTMNLGGAQLAAIGPGTAQVLHDAGLQVSLTPDAAVGEAFADAFPHGDGRVLQLRPVVARDVVADGLRSKGWTVNAVVAYRTVACDVDDETAARLKAADAVVFTSASTVDNLVAAVGTTQLPAVTVSIGPITSTALRKHGVEPSVEAQPHTIDGILDALSRVFGH